MLSWAKLIESASIIIIRDPSNNSDWFVIFNENNQLPHRAFGTPIATNNLFTFLSANNFSLPTDLREEFSIKNDKYINTAYVQYYNHLEVVNSQLYAKFTINNELVSFNNLDNYGETDLLSEEYLQKAVNQILVN